MAMKISHTMKHTYGDRPSSAHLMGPKQSLQRVFQSRSYIGRRKSTAATALTQQENYNALMKLAELTVSKTDKATQEYVSTLRELQETKLSVSRDLVSVSRDLDDKLDGFQKKLSSNLSTELEELKRSSNKVSQTLDKLSENQEQIKLSQNTWQTGAQMIVVISGILGAIGLQTMGTMPTWLLVVLCIVAAIVGILVVCQWAFYAATSWAAIHKSMEDKPKPANTPAANPQA